MTACDKHYQLGGIFTDSFAVTSAAAGIVLLPLF